MSGQVEQWWQWLYEPLRELEREGPWPQRRAAFLDRLGVTDPEQYPVVEELLRQLDELPDDERPYQLAAEPLDRRAYEIVEQETESEPEPAEAHEEVAEPADDDGTVEFDESAWRELLTECGPYWDVTEEGWQPFVVWFCHQADERGVGAPARQLVDHLATLSVTDRVEVFHEYGVVLYPRWFADVDADLVREEPALAEVALHTRLCWAVAVRAEQD